VRWMMLAAQVMERAARWRMMGSSLARSSRMALAAASRSSAKGLGSGVGIGQRAMGSGEMQIAKGHMANRRAAL